MYRYKAIKIHGKKYDEHRIIMEIYLCRSLLSDESVHHRNKNCKDNRIENLQLMTKSSHTKLHSNQHDLYTGGRKKQPLPHGTHQGYSYHGCRCLDCKHAHNNYMKNYYLLHK